MSIEISTLDNGLRVVTDRMETVETASLGVWVDVGTRHEQAAINGVSHLLEHMAFKGTRRRTPRAIAEEIEAVGGLLNAYTSREHTAYYAKVLKEDIGLALDIVADILQNSTLDDEELARERGVVIQEINQAVDTPDDIVFDHFQAAAYPDQPLGRPVLGTVETVRGMSREVVAGYLARTYGAGRMVLSAAGNVDHAALVAMAEDAFGGLSPRSEAREEPARYVGGEHREDRRLEQVHVVLGFDGPGYLDDGFYASQVLSTLLGGGMSSRLFQEVRERRGLAYSVFSFSSSYVDGGLFGVYAGTGEDEAAELLPVLCDEVLKVTNAIADDELARARAQIKAGVLMALESTSSRCEQLARQMLIFGRPVPTEEVVAKIEAVDAAAVRATASRILATPPTLAVIGPLGRVEEYDRVRARLAG